MSTTTKPSEGAVRAGKAIYDLCREAAIKAGARTGGQVLADNYALCAEIIEGETHAGEMLEALELLIAQGAFPTEAYEKALAVILKVRGGE